MCHATMKPPVGPLILNGFRSGPDSILDPEGLDIGEPVVQCHRIVEVSAPSLKDQTECSRKSKHRISGDGYMRQRQRQSWELLDDTLL